ncbi:MAG: ATP-binding protein, partial [Candidatus Cloacimonetes bacterium]|nr:ATP-binding protein [Candidatus Cloacimonadota bacterium]
KIESGKMELIINAFNPRMLIEDVLKTYRVQNKNPDLEIRHVINERIPDILYGDQLRFKQIIVNLLQNAVKFTESGFVEINADIYTVNDSLIRLLFCVSDTGIGIDHNKQHEIFDDFNQADANITGKYGGTGLGLSIVKRLVQLMNGFIWVESEPGKGSSFYFILPFEVTHEQPQIPSGESTLSEKGRSSLLGMRVLLVEDEPINQVVTLRQLESWKIEVTLAANGKEALEKCSVNNYDAILMDIQMPVMDGITATQTLRLQEIPKNRHTPIIAFTAAALVGDRERFLEHGMDDYIAKPIELNQLHRILAKYWHRS